MRRQFVRANLCVMLFVIVLGLSAQAGESVGIVLMHGKNARPKSLQTLVDALAASGYQVDVPEMCWSRQRIYDLSYLECLRDVDTAVVRLQSRGATAIFVGGQSLGANAALAFAATREGVTGVIAMAPSHDPARMSRRAAIAGSLTTAHGLVATGKGDEPASFNDINGGREFLVRTTASIYLSFFAPDGPAVIRANAARVQVPLLWIAGDSDPTQLGPGYAFASARNPKNRYVTVSADHLGTPAASSSAILEWLMQLGGN
jgi:esterase/lipase